MALRNIWSQTQSQFIVNSIDAGAIISDSGRIDFDPKISRSGNRSSSIEIDCVCLRIENRS